MSYGHPLPHSGDCGCNFCMAHGPAVREHEVWRNPDNPEDVRLRHGPASDMMPHVKQEPTPNIPRDNSEKHRCNCPRCDWHDDTPEEKALIYAQASRQRQALELVR